MMKKVNICPPLGGNIELNIDKVKRYTKLLECGAAPVVPHFCAMCIDDSVPKNREIVICAGLNLLWFCDEMWVFGDEITEGMQREINFCKNLNIRVVYISDEKAYEKKINKNTSMRCRTDSFSCALCYTVFCGV